VWSTPTISSGAKPWTSTFWNVMAHPWLCIYTNCLGQRVQSLGTWHMPNHTNQLPSKRSGSVFIYNLLQQHRTVAFYIQMTVMLHLMVGSVLDRCISNRFMDIWTGLHTRQIELLGFPLVRDSDSLIACWRTHPQTGLVQCVSVGMTSVS
jgi:hypothetical protein